MEWLKNLFRGGNKFKGQKFPQDRVRGTPEPPPQPMPDFSSRPREKKPNISRSRLPQYVIGPDGTRYNHNPDDTYASEAGKPLDEIILAMIQTGENAWAEKRGYTVGPERGNTGGMSI